MAENVQQSPKAIPRSQPIPRFIQSQLDHPPIGPNESAAEFKLLFHELGGGRLGRSPLGRRVRYAASGDNNSHFVPRGLERIRSAIVQHMRPEAVVALIHLADGEAERGSIATFEAYDTRKKYFATKEGKTKVEALFSQAGYTSDLIVVSETEILDGPTAASTLPISIWVCCVIGV